MTKAEICFNHYYTYQELTDYLNQVSEAYPDLISLKSVGTSFEGRDIWAVTVTDFNSGNASDKPAIYLDGNIHAGEVTGCMVCLKVIDYLISNRQSDEVQRLLKTKTFYILPRVNPDGAEKYLTTPFTLRSSVRQYPFDNYSDLAGLHPQDINEDGQILLMRVRDDARGEWKISAKDDRIMLPRRPGEQGAAFYHIYPEGIINKYEDNSFVINRTPYGLDLNRNFPSNWDKENISGGPYPTSEPEVKAIVDFILDHKNIGALNCFHTTGGFYYRNPYTYSDEEMDTDDLRATQEIAREGFYVNGYSDVKSNNRSTLTEWAYEHQGIIGYTTELWNRQERAGLKREDIANAKTVEEIEEINLKLLNWNDMELSGRGFQAWQEFQHPQLGSVEIGGWDFKYAVQNPPPHLLDQECFKNALWALKQAAALPECLIAEVKVENINDNIYKIVVSCENHGYLPSYITNKGKTVGAVTPDKLSISGNDIELLQGKDCLELGYLEGYMNGQKRRYFSYGDAAKSFIKRSFLVKAVRLPATLNIKLQSQRGGTTEKEIILE